MSNIHTYADGFGRWNAVVPNTLEARGEALKAIRRELVTRDMLTFEGATVYLEIWLTERKHYDTSKRHFVEYENN